MESLAEKLRKQDENMLKNNPTVANMEYYKIFNYKERVAARCSGEYRCHLCNDIIFYTDILNLEDALEYGIAPLMVCSYCRHSHNASFQEKKTKYHDRLNPN